MTKNHSHASVSAAAEAKPEVVEPPKLARVPLPSGALAAVAAQLKQYTSAREQHLLAVADKAATAASPVATEDTLAQQWQVRARLAQCCSQLCRLICRAD